MKINRSIKRIGLVLLLVLLVAGGVLLVKKKKAELASEPMPMRAVMPVTVVDAPWGMFDGYKGFLGTLKPKIAADIAPRITAYIVDVTVREGERVKKGDLLVRLDDREQRDSVDAVSAQLAAARTEFAAKQGVLKRDEELFKAKAISREALDLSRAATAAARAQVITLEKQLQTAKTSLSYTILKAPFDGVVSRRIMEPGDLGMPGKAVVSLEAPDAGYFVEIRVPQRELSSMKVGDAVRIFPDAASMHSKALQAGISRIHPSVQSGTLGTVEADVQQRPFSLPSGSAIKASIKTGSFEGYKVPLRALLENVKSVSIFTVSNNTVHKVPVRLLYRGYDWAVAIPEGGSAGRDRETLSVITAQESALLRLHNGQKVAVTHIDWEDGI